MNETSPLRNILKAPLLALCLAIVAQAPSARAQQKDEEQSKVAAAAFFAKGQQLVKERQFVAAIEAFKRAYQLRPHYFVQCSIARCHQTLNDMVRAAEHYKRCLKEGADKSEMAKRVENSLRAVEAQITWVTVRSPGSGGELFLDGIAAGRAPGRIPVNPGRHVLEVRKRGADPARTTIKTLGGEQREVTLVPLVRDKQPPVDPPTSAPVKTDEQAGRGLPQYWFWGAAGATVALTITAIVLGVQTLGYGTDYDEDPTEATYNAFVDRRLLTNIFWVAAAVAGGGTTALFFYTDFGGKPAAGPKDEAGLTFGLAWRGAF